jgi:hypothetical protein
VDGQHGAVPLRELILESAPTDPPERIQPLSKTHTQEFVVPLSDGSKAVFQWPTSLSKEDVADLKDSLKIVEHKIARSEASTEESKQP